MTDEERDRAIDFIITTQAKFAADIAAEAEERKARGAETAMRVERLERIAKLFVRAGRRERREGRERFDALLDAQLRNEASIAALADVVRYLAAGRNGNG